MLLVVPAKLATLSLSTVEYIGMFDLTPILLLLGEAEALIASLKLLSYSLGLSSSAPIFLLEAVNSGSSLPSVTLPIMYLLFKVLWFISGLASLILL